MKALEAKFGAGLRRPEEPLARDRRRVARLPLRAGETGQVAHRGRDAGAEGGGPGRAALIQHQAPLILDRLNLYLGAGAVARLRIVQGPITRPAAKTAPSRRARPPLDAAAERKLAEGLAKAPEGPLKSALLRLGREVLRGGSR